MTNYAAMGYALLVADQMKMTKDKKELSWPGFKQLSSERQIDLLYGMCFYVTLGLENHRLHRLQMITNGVRIMELAARNKQQPKQYSNNDVFGMLDRGIDDMEAERELPMEAAF